MTDAAGGLVWYAAYGSNCSRERFAAYLEGGTVDGAQGVHRGARDPSPPRADGPVRFDRQIVFAGVSRRWGGGSAFLGHTRVGDGALGRRYLITRQQFDDVIAQENRRDRVSTPLDDLAPGEIRPVAGGAYDAVLALAPVDRIPVVTFTATRPPEQRDPAPPTAAYLTTILRGLVAVHRLATEAIVERLLSAPGVAPTWSVAGLSALLADGKEAVRPMPERGANPTLRSGGTGNARTT